MQPTFKFLLAISLLFASSATIAGDKSSQANEPIEQVFETPGHNRDQIFTSTKIWVAENFRSSKAVLEYENKEEGTLIGNGIIPFPCSGAFDCLLKPNWKVRFTMRVDMKDDKFRLTFSNVNLTWPPSYSAGISSPAYDGPVNSKKDSAKIRTALLALGPQLQAAMSTTSVKDDW